MAGHASHPRRRRDRARAGAGSPGPTANAKAAAEIVARYPDGAAGVGVDPACSTSPSGRSARRPDTQGWLPIPVIEFVARELDMPVDPRARGRDLLHHVQPRAGRPLPRPGVRDDAVHAARLGRRARGLQQARAEEGPHHRRRPVHADRGRMPRRLRQRADGPDQRRQLRGSDRGQHGRDPRRAGRAARRPSPARRSTARPAAPRAARPRSRKWPSAITTIGGSGDGTDIVKIVVAIVHRSSSRGRSSRASSAC